MNYEAIFKAYDRDKDGFLNAKELKKCIKKALGDKYSSKDVKFLISCADKDENGRMDCEEFLEAVTLLKSEKLENLRELREVFVGFDLNGDGTISEVEFRQCMEQLGQTMTAEECKEMVTTADKDGDGLIRFLEFVPMVKEAMKTCSLLDDEQTLRETFNMFDENKDGTVDRGELRKALATLNHEVPTDKELDDMFKLVDLNGDGRITFDEFRTLLN